MELELHLRHGGRMKPLDEPVFDELLASLGNDPARVRKVYGKFLDTAVARLQEVRHQSVAESAATFHALKGSASMVGASRMAALAAKLQEAAPRLDNETKVAAIEELEAELARFRLALSEKIGTP